MPLPQPLQAHGRLTLILWPMISNLIQVGVAISPMMVTTLETGVGIHFGKAIGMMPMIRGSLGHPIDNLSVKLVVSIVDGLEKISTFGKLCTKTHFVVEHRWQDEK